MAPMLARCRVEPVDGQANPRGSLMMAGAAGRAI